MGGGGPDISRLLTREVCGGEEWTTVWSAPRQGNQPIMEISEAIQSRRKMSDWQKELFFRVCPPASEFWEGESGILERSWAFRPDFPRNPLL